MNPGAIEETGATARATIDALKTSPMMLAILIFNIVILGLVAWSGFDTRNHYDKLYQSLLENQAKLLDMCSARQKL